MAGSTIGSPAYMAPEQIGDSASATPSVDVYGLGATMYHSITGQRPIEGRNTADILGKLRTEEPEPLRAFVPDIPQALDDLVMHMLAKTPIKRPQHAREVVEAIDKIIENPDAPYAGKPGSGSANSKLPIIIISVVVLVVLAALAASML